MTLARTLRLTAAALAVSLALPAAAQTDLVDPENRAILRSEIRAYLLEHPEVIMEAIEVLEQRRQAAEAHAETRMLESVAGALEDDGFSHVAGNPEGDVTVVEFLDYNCGYCRRAHEAVKKLVEGDGNIRFVVKEFPILGPESVVASRAALASAKQQDGALYMAFNDAMMTHGGRLSETAVYDIAEEVGLDVEQLREDAASDEISEQIAKTRQLAQALRIEGTPTFVVGGRLIRGYVPYEKLVEAVETAREEKS